jgi:hypothetical protein
MEDAENQGLRDFLLDCGTGFGAEWALGDVFGWG